MRVALDTDVILSLMLFPSKRMTALYEHVISHHVLIITPLVISELQTVIERKFPDKEGAVEVFLASMPYEKGCFNIPEIPDLYFRDPKDIPILLSALASQADIPITGDKDLIEAQDLPIKVMSPKELPQVDLAGALVSRTIRCR